MGVQSTVPASVRSASWTSRSSPTPCGQPAHLTPQVLVATGNPGPGVRPRRTSPRGSSYVPEEFTSEEADVLRRYFTNLDGPVFALVNLPEVVKGALFARYSRSPKSLRRLFLDEFVGDLDITGDQSIDATVGSRAGRGAVREGLLRVRRRLGRPARRRAPGLRAGVEPAHQDPRVGTPDELPRAEHALHRLRLPPRRPLPLLPRSGGARRAASAPATSATWTACSTPTADGRRTVTDHVRATVPARPGRQRLRLPPGHAGQGARRRARHAAGGVALERRHLRHRPGVRGAAAADARPSAARGPRLRRPDAARAAQGHPQLPAPGRHRPTAAAGGASYLATTRDATPPSSSTRCSASTPVDPAPAVELVDWDPDAEDKLLAAICYPHSDLPEQQLLERVRRLGIDERVSLLRAYVGERENRRHKPGRAFERS